VCECRTACDALVEGTVLMKSSWILGSLGSLAIALSLVSGTFAASANFDFSTTGVAGILDAQGQSTGLTARLSGTGTALPTNSPNLDISTTTGKLLITTGNGIGANQETNGGAGLDTAEMVGLNLSSLGFTGSQDFIVSATFDALPATTAFDQGGIFVGQSGAALTQAGYITFSDQEYFSVHVNPNHNNGRFFGFGFNGTDGMTVAITRISGDWRYFIDGLEWQPNTDGGGNGTPVDPTGANGSPNLQGLTDLTVGVFAVNVINGASETVAVDSFDVIVDPVAGDANGNGTVGPEDFALISDNLFNVNGVPGLNGDVTFDGNVGYDDFRLWKNVAPLSALIAVGLHPSVPEPTALSLAALALIGAALKGRRNRR
jgi:hypothetical protein